MKENKNSLADKIKSKLKAIGPGAIIAASFIGPGTVTTTTQAGASFGYALLWAVLFSIIATMVLQEMTSRLGIISREGLGEAIRKEFSHPFVKYGSMILIIAAVGIGCASYISGDLSGGSAGLATLTGLPQRILGPVLGFIVLGLLLTGSYKLIEKALIFLVAVMSVTFVTTMLVAKPDFMNVLNGMFNPSIPSGSIITIVALIGTTVVPYNLFIHASTVQNRWKKEDGLTEARWDIGLSIGVGGIITSAILITSGTVIYGSGLVVNNIADLSLQLEPLLGEWAKVFLSIGIFSAGLSSATATPLGAAYTFAGVLGWEPSMSDKRFKTVAVVIVMIGIIMSATGIEPISIIIVAQAINGLLLPVISIFLLYIVNGLVPKSLNKFL